LPPSGLPLAVTQISLVEWRVSTHLSDRTGKDLCVKCKALKWAEGQFGEVELGDKRRTDRAVKMGAAVAGAPTAS
jgi:hypothetical protein